MIPERWSRAFCSHEASRQFMEVIVNQRREHVERLRVPVAPGD
jgi:hypothetical protein